MGWTSFIYFPADFLQFLKKRRGLFVIELTIIKFFGPVCENTEVINSTMGSFENSLFFLFSSKNALVNLRK
jgi:hypothetical protein